MEENSMRNEAVENIPVTYEAVFEYQFPSGETVLVECGGEEIEPWRLGTIWMKFYNLEGDELDVIYDADVFFELELEIWNQLYLIKNEE